MDQESLIKLINEQKEEIEQLKKQVYKGNQLLLASNYVIASSVKFLSSAIEKLDIAAKNYEKY